MRSISVKLSFVYIVLAIFNISLFTFMIYENQIDLITENTKYKAEDFAKKIYAALQTVTTELNQAAVNTGEAAVVDKITAAFQSSVLDYILFKIDAQNKGITLSGSNPAFILTEDMAAESVRAAANREFTGQLYYSKIDNARNEILFFIPVNLWAAEDNQLIFLFKMKMAGLSSSINSLYRLVTIIIIFIALFHAVIAFIIHRIIVYPIRILDMKSSEISKGNLQARVNIKHKDEIGHLACTFNTMAESVEKTICDLNGKNKIMKMELEMAAEVQKSIYPHIRNGRYFDIAVYHKPLMDVSGDYHNILALGKERYGVIVADVCGHGVSAALITMLIKDQFEGQAPHYFDTKELLFKIGRVFKNLMLQYGKFFTAFYLIIVKNELITFSNAAHPSAFLFRPGVNSIKTLDTAGVFIGLPIHETNHYGSKSIRVKTGDKIILYTDGITEAKNAENELYGPARLQQTAVKNADTHCSTILEKILVDLDQFSVVQNRRDDETLIVIEMKEPELQEKK